MGWVGVWEMGKILGLRASTLAFVLALFGAAVAGVLSTLLG
jgi:hypothetical protein